MELLRKLYILIIFSAFFCASVKAQSYFTLESLIEEVLEEKEVAGAESWIEYLYYLQNNPLNINSATRTDLNQLQFLTAYQIESLHAYIYEFGALTSIYELQVINGFDKITAQRLALFTKIGSDTEVLYSSNYSKDTTYINGEALLKTGRTLERLKGSEEGFLGSPWQLGFKTKLSKGKFKYGLTYDKDVGEQFWDTYNRAPEYLSLSLEYEGAGILKNLIVGNYRVNFGQGLGLWQNFGFGKSSLVMSNLKTSKTFQSHTSASEYNFFRGAAASFTKGAFDIDVFGSWNKLDAGIHADSLGEFVSSDYQNGYHRTKSELSRKDQMAESAGGARVQWTNRWLKLAANAHVISYDKQLIDEHTQQKTFGALSMDYFFSFSSLLLWGELASDRHGNASLLSGAQIYPTDNLALSLFWRQFADEFKVRYSQPFSERGIGENETGLYLGMEFSPLAGLKIQSYADVFYFNAPLYNADGPSAGFEVLNNLVYSWGEASRLTLKYKIEEKEKNFNGDFNKNLRAYQKQSLRLNLKFKALKSLFTQSRIELIQNTISGDPERGWMLMQDVMYDKLDASWGIDARIALFNTDSYYSGIYAYEPDVLHAFSVPVYYGSGMRYVLSGKIKYNKNTTLYFKFGQFRFFDRNTISSGIMEINGSIKTEMRLQLRCRF